MKRIIEPVKSILIIVLTLSMIYMSARLMSTDLFAEGTGSIEKTKGTFLTGLGLSFLSDYFDDSGSYVSSEFSAGTLLCPYSISYHSSDGCTGVFDSASELAYMYDNMNGVIAGCVTGDITGSEKSFESYLENDGTLIDFGRQLPLDIICRLAANTAPRQSGLAVEKLFVYQDDGAMYMVFTDGSNTYLFDGRDVTLPTMRPGNAMTDTADIVSNVVNIKRGSVVPTSQITLPVIYRSSEIYNDEEGNYSFSNLASILSLFGVNSGSRGSETRDDGSIIYVENRKSIMVHTNGNVIFSTSQDNGGIDISAIIGESDELGYSVRDVLIASQRFLATFEENVLGGDAVLRLKNAYFDTAAGGYVTEFEHCMDGISVSGDEPVARLVYKNGYFISAEIRFEKYDIAAQENVTFEKLSNLLRLYYGRSGTIDKIRVAYVGDDVQTPQFCFYWD